MAFRDTVRDLLAKECAPAVVRAAWEAAPGELDRGVWDSLEAMGVLGVLVPEHDGGLGLDETWLVPDPRGGGPRRASPPARRDGDGRRAAAGRGAGHAPLAGEILRLHRVLQQHGIEH